MGNWKEKLENLSTAGKTTDTVSAFEIVTDSRWQPSKDQTNGSRGSGPPTFW